MKDQTSPDSFIDMGFYGMIGAALQRRVYIGSDERQLFGNQFIILVSDPGIGKGLVLKPVAEFLKTLKLRKLKVEKPDVPKLDADTVQALMNELQEANGVKLDTLDKFKNKRADLEEPLLIPVAADATTFESLIEDHEKALRTINTNCVSKLVKNGMYSHSSLCFALEEVSSLFRKHTEDVVNYLIRSFDCGDYVYKTKNKGKFRVINPCLNFLGGTQPNFIRDVFSDKLLNEGFASRCIFVYEEENRFYRFDLNSISAEQEAAKQQIISHIEQLTKLFGPVRYSPEAYVFMKHYIEDTLGRQRQRINPSPKLLHYYSRKNIHVQKLAMAIHFADNTTMEIDIASCQQAIEILDKLELKMHHALNLGGRSPIGAIAVSIVKHLTIKGPSTLTDIWMAMIDQANEKEMNEAITFLQASGQVRQQNKDNKILYHV